MLWPISVPAFCLVGTSCEALDFILRVLRNFLYRFTCTGSMGGLGLSNVGLLGLSANVVRDVCVLAMPVKC